MRLTFVILLDTGIHTHNENGGTEIFAKKKIIHEGGRDIETNYKAIEICVIWDKADGQLPQAS